MKTKTKSQRKDDLILDAIDTFDRLGRDAMARIDSRIWHEHFRRRARKLGLMPKEKKKSFDTLPRKR